MADLPTDLVPLPTMPYDVRPDALPLDIEECRTALWLERGNISEAARRIKVAPARFRAFVKSSPRLQGECDEAREQLQDIAEDIAYEALTDESDAGRRDQMARFVMGTLGKSRGFGQNGGASVNINSPKGPITIKWGDGTTLSAPGDNAVDVTPKVVNG